MKKQKNFTPDATGEGFTLRTGQPASLQVYRYLRYEILRGGIEPDTHLSEANLCHYFEVSRQPVREALLRLSVENLVRIYPQRGSVVTRISVPMVHQAQLIREAVEVEMVRRAVDARDTGLLRALDTELEVQNTYAKAGQWARFFESDQRFHQLIFEKSGVAGVWEALESSHAQLDRVRQADLQMEEVMGLLVDQHRSIFDGIAAGDAPRAVQAMQQHLRRVLESLTRARARAPELFDDVDPALEG
ncbi:MULTISPECIES: GntR family transcriptional regulator [Paracoccaceae]|jgi:DNA-binding GntR family transcriptional regulator|uniref:GntR family transcriptional regulator n=1 Tax=Rhodobacterales TaxID=204455 RepID=UPI001D0B1C9B|nr:GntR family transcriptional regulator [Boseongicola sp. H5]